MPKEMETAARAYCRKQGLKPGTDRFDNCVYGAMHKIGWKPKKSLTKKKGG